MLQWSIEMCLSPWWVQPPKALRTFGELREFGDMASQKQAVAICFIVLSSLQEGVEIYQS
jgi:hypothetical protein